MLEFLDFIDFIDPEDIPWPDDEYLYSVAGMEVTDTVNIENVVVNNITEVTNYTTVYNEATAEAAALLDMDEKTLITVLGGVDPHNVSIHVVPYLGVQIF